VNNRAKRSGEAVLDEVGRRVVLVTAAASGVGAALAGAEPARSGRPSMAMAD
jgi:NADP-dependent 3-hydroxy acid dehydrogenase YdfG